MFLSPLKETIADHADNRRSFNAEAQFQLQTDLSVQVALRQVSLRGHRLFVVNIILPVLYTHSFTNHLHCVILTIDSVVIEQCVNCMGWIRREHWNALVGMRIVCTMLVSRTSSERKVVGVLSVFFWLKLLFSGGGGEGGRGVFYENGN